MPICEADAIVTTVNSHTVRSRVGASLRRLHRTLQQTREVEHGVTNQFAQWQEKWSSRKEQIAQRLEIIDRQLEHLVQDHLRRPQLSVLNTVEELGGVQGVLAADVY